MRKKEFTKKQLKTKLGKCITDKSIARAKVKIIKNKKKIDSRYKIEKELILSHAKNDVAWIGEVGFSNMIRLDGSLNNSSIKTTKLKNGEIRIIKK